MGLVDFTGRAAPGRRRRAPRPGARARRARRAVAMAPGLAAVAMLLAAVGPADPPAVTALSYYISASSGSDSNDGRSASSPWRSLWRANQTALPPGTKLLLRRGDTWTDEMLQLSVRGELDRHVRISAYGDISATRPLIKGHNKTTDIAMLLDNAGFIDIDGLAFSTAKIGLYLRYWQSYGHESVSVTNCTFEEINDPVGLSSLSPQPAVFSCSAPPVPPRCHHYRMSI